MDLLPLPLIGWLYTLVCGGALLLGAWIIVGLHLRDAEGRRHLASRVLDDTALFAIWILGLAGGIGVLRGHAWSRPVLELFCIALMGLVSLSAWGRYRNAPPPRAALALSLLLFVAPVLMLCVATIATLRSAASAAALSG